MASIENDAERRYTGTNFAVLTLIVLLVLVGGYFLIAQSKDAADDPATRPLTEYDQTVSGLSSE